MNKCLEMGVADGPSGGWKIVMVVRDGESSIKRLLRRIRDLAINEEDFLIHLARDQPIELSQGGLSNNTYP